jgi:hypothetical protein
MVNDEVLRGKRLLLSGDFISIVGNKMRWESGKSTTSRKFTNSVEIKSKPNSMVDISRKNRRDDSEG